MGSGPTKPPGDAAIAARPVRDDEVARAQPRWPPVSDDGALAFARSRRAAFTAGPHLVGLFARLRTRRGHKRRSLLDQLATLDTGRRTTKATVVADQATGA